MIPAGVTRSAGQAALVPSQVSSSSQGPLTGRHNVDAGSGVQVPTLPATLHASHAPAQGLLQHTPSTHWPDWHWDPVVQAAPLAEEGGEPPHVPEAQLLDRHSFGAVQVAPSAFRATQAPPPQYLVGPHWPSSVQAEGQVPSTPLQAYRGHRGDPGWPAARTVQAPSPAAPSEALHTSHPPVHAALQHTPSEQWPEPHMPSLVQGAPRASEPAWQ